MPPPFGLALFNFAVLVFIVVRFGGPAIVRRVRTRHDEIARELSEGKRLRAEAQAKLDEYKTRLANLDKEVDALLNGIRAEAEAERAALLKEARERSERLRKDAEAQIQGELQQARAQIEREAVATAIAIAEQILAERTTPADLRNLTDRFVAALEASRPRAPQA